MKLFQRLLVAPAALGLLAPVAAGVAGSANASELNLDGVGDYSSSREQVTSISQFSDVYPTDWAYQALSNLIERYGCVAGYPDGTYRGGRAMTRFEAAALLNACLDRITEVTDELKRLMKEFEKELAILKGRVDGLEARVGELEANQFSTTTKLNGVAYMVIGANSFGGDAEQGARDLVLGTNASDGDGGFVTKGFGSDRAEAAAAASGGTVFNYDLRIDLDTSFTGKDLLRTRLRAGNFGDSPFGGGGYVGLTGMEVAFEEDGDDTVNINRLFYQFPVGENWTVTAGARVRQDDMLAVWPSAYPDDTILDIFTYAGAPGAYNLTLGGGGGLWWESGDFSISALYVSGNADDGNPNTGGIATDGAASTGTVQLAYAPSNWGLAAAYTYSSGDNGAGIYAGNGTPLANTLSAAGRTNAVGVSAWWEPENPGWIPGISAGWGLNSVDTNDDTAFGTIIDSGTSQSWYVGLQWKDAFLKGNTLGMAVGQATFVTNLEVDDDFDDVLTDWAGDGNYAWEWWYKFQVTDNISLTPAIYYLSRPYGQLTNGTIDGDRDDTFNNFGGLVKATFKF
ncbi:porin [Synechococcus sp. RSCCF101]|uniref:iron uptake porin n=1 Tax=Synechococcus sp. RSCCF101 TaxID=2511069 RepID=UPI0012486CAC|nr:iron uptake porin [Synechococcus sp. RSCCF101]QEY32902.1 porin [Synechococcus sp. RSCCF101]